MWTVFSKEVNSFLNSLIAYVVIAVFLTGIGLLMWVFPETSVLDYGYADMETLFSLGPYVLMFLIPAITMRLFAEEKKGGTLELLLTRPLSEVQIIGGKYLAGLFLVVFTLLPTALYYFSISSLGNPPGNLDTAGILGSYVGLVLLGAAFTSIGLMASSLSENQIIAFILAVFLCFFLFTGFTSIAAINVWGSYSLFLEQLGMLTHYNSLSKGLLDSRDIVYFLSVIFIFLLITRLKLNQRI
ncbi:MULTISPECIES: gliding motility-associated ABC transporter permease subunit GldF [unclassified Imperialibacter]|uniref:gliding motility-associated ABC transporter permease subunit GldF n=1 Tax=unclassified Imperialibacter TaxID=2629706 RepID=UPI0012553924|nr:MULTISPECIES: gliding motility-associated ABC transporter permease subunit GldF [unclassified Imperialibacter]CAD5285137.1 Gliding motility protein GldF [Imperialibacter sp. 75]CAD5296862.1 Gliding motility protein GldF [Imperialibacter sp. 89]VVT24064.1 Gliding motility protein GldF [Imperialibacter sp. EC-SDR9]|tara:strand:- start:22367 stop:23092 length:726 start_codon:yes stop_codon:yes gene_type:complete